MVLEPTSVVHWASNSGLSPDRKWRERFFCCCKYGNLCKTAELWHVEAVLAFSAISSIALQVVAIYDNPKIQFESKFFYPLMVIPELGVLAIICVPGFINHVLKGPQAQRELDPIHPPTMEV